MTTTNPFDTYILRIYGGTEGGIDLLLCYNGTAFVGRIDF
jgi:hypothetical protein